MCLLMPFISYNQIRNISLLYFSSNDLDKIGLKCLARSLLTKGAAQFNYKIYAYYTIKPITMHPIREKISKMLFPLLPCLHFQKCSVNKVFS